eukprot:8632548-Pyramimonas_sp.AAC.1
MFRSTAAAATSLGRLPPSPPPPAATHQPITAILRLSPQPIAAILCLSPQPIAAILCLGPQPIAAIRLSKRHPADARRRSYANAHHTGRRLSYGRTRRRQRGEEAPRPVQLARGGRRVRQQGLRQLSEAGRGALREDRLRHHVRAPVRGEDVGQGYVAHARQARGRQLRQPVRPAAAKGENLAR